MLRGYAVDHPRADLLRHSALHARVTLPLPAELKSEKLVPFVIGHHKKLLPLHTWIVESMG